MAGAEPRAKASASEVALWAGLAAFFGNIVGLKVLESITGNEWGQFAGALLLSVLVGGAVYSKERLAGARRIDSGG